MRPGGGRSDGTASGSSIPPTGRRTQATDHRSARGRTSGGRGRASRPRSTCCGPSRARVWSRDPQRARDIIARAAQGAAGDCNADLDALERAELAEAEAAARAQADAEAEKQRAVDAADRETRRRQAARAAAAAELERFDREEPAP